MKKVTFPCTYTHTYINMYKARYIFTACSDIYMNINWYEVCEHIHAHVHLHLHPEHEHEPEHVQGTRTCTFSCTYMYRHEHVQSI